MRGRIRLARNDTQAALEDAAEALSQARDSNEPQMLYPALAVCAHALAAAGEHGEGARLADELLAEWRSKLNQFPASSWVVDLACALELLGREGELAEAAAGVLNSSVWLDAAIAFSHGEFEVASALFAAIGSRPDEAFARLRAAEIVAETGSDTDATVELDRHVPSSVTSGRLPTSPVRMTCSPPAGRACNQRGKVVDSAAPEKGAAVSTDGSDWQGEGSRGVRGTDHGQALRRPPLWRAALWGSPLWCAALWCSPLRCSALRCSALRCSPVWRPSVRGEAVRRERPGRVGSGGVGR